MIFDQCIIFLLSHQKSIKFWFEPLINLTSIMRFIKRINLIVPFTHLVTTTNVFDVLCRFQIMSDRKNEYDLWRDLIFNYNIPSKLLFCVQTCPNNCGVVVAGHNGCCVLYCFRCCDYQNTVLTARGMLLCQICHIHVNTVLLSFSIYMLVLVKFLF